MNILNITTKRLTGFAFSFALVVAMVATLYVPSARAQTVADLQAQISQLLAQIAALQGGNATADVCPYTWTRSLGTGSTGVDVMALQRFLNASPDTRLALTGAGSPGLETQYYGPITAAAVSKFQVKYRSEILTPLGLVNPTGYFGPSSMVKANSLCLTGSPTVPGDNNDNNDLRGGAGFLEDVDYMSSINNERVGEGDSDVEVAGYELEADEGSDLRVTAVRVAFEEQGAGGSDDFDDYADEVSIWLDGDEVGSMRVRDMNDSRGIWSGTIVLDDSAIIRRGDMADLTINVSSLRNIDSSDLGSSNNRWRAGLTMLRYVDASGAAITENSLGDIISNSQLGTQGRAFHFDTFASAAGVELRVSESDDNPTAGTVQVDDRGGDEVVLLVGELRGSGSDIEISGLTTTITPVGASIEEIASQFILRIDGKNVDYVDADECEDATNDCSNDAGQTATYVFDDFEYELREDDTVDFEIVAELNRFGGNFTEGDSLEATVRASDIEAEDESGTDLTGSALRGTVSGDTIRFASTGVTSELVSSSAVSVTNVSNDSTDDQGQFTMEFRVSAFEDTAWVPLSAASSTDADADNVGAAFSVVNASTGAVVSDGTSIAVLTRVSGGTVSGNFVRINAGQTATFRLTVYYDPTVTGIYRVQLNQIGYNQSSATSPDQAHTPQPQANFRSASVQVLN